MTSAAVAPTQPSLSRARLVGRRLLAALVDLVLVPSTVGRLGLIAVGDQGAWLGRVLGLGAAIGAQAVVGASFGMAVVGLVVVRSEGGPPPGWGRSLRRHAWLPLLALGAVPSLLFGVDLPNAALLAVSVVGSALGLLSVMLPPVLLGTVVADPDGQGLHDRWAGCRVLPTEAPGHRPVALGLVVWAWLAVTVSSWWLATPAVSDAGDLGGPDVTAATCDLTWASVVGPGARETVEVAQGMDLLEVQLGPVVVRFDDQPFPSRLDRFGEDVFFEDGDGLHYQVLVPAVGGGSSSSGRGGGLGVDGGEVTREVEISNVLGDFTMACTGQGGPEPLTPAARPSG